MNIMERIMERVPGYLAASSRTAFRAGDIVTVRPYEEILETLDQDGFCGGVLFMPNMRQYCSRRLNVLKPVRWIYDEKYREMLSCDDIVVLSGATCDGKGMLNGEDCGRSCSLFWKTAWLRRASTPEEAVEGYQPRARGRLQPSSPVQAEGGPPSTAEQHRMAGSKLDLYRKTLRTDVPLERGAAGYVCQYTCLDRMGREFDAAEIGWHLGLRTWASLKRRTLRTVRKAGTLTSRLYPRPEVSPGADRPGGAGEDLARGDVVEVLPHARIAHTLDGKGRCKGLRFMDEMKAFCGRQSRVLAMPRSILDLGGDKVRKAKDIVILEGFYCDGADISGCDRACLYYWRKEWLSKVSGPAPDIPGPG